MEIEFDRSFKARLSQFLVFTTNALILFGKSYEKVTGKRWERDYIGVKKPDSIENVINHLNELNDEEIKDILSDMQTRFSPPFVEKLNDILKEELGYWLDKEGEWHKVGGD
ncbi:MAG: hypothetical protein ACE5K4_00070 [Candidatus Hydrothermarchaeota archaeon]